MLRPLAYERLALDSFSKFNHPLDSRRPTSVLYIYPSTPLHTIQRRISRSLRTYINNNNCHDHRPADTVQFSFGGKSMNSMIQGTFPFYIRLLSPHLSRWRRRVFFSPCCVIKIPHDRLSNRRNRGREKGFVLGCSSCECFLASNQTFAEYRFGCLV